MNAAFSAQSQNLVYQSGQWQIDLGRRELLSSGVAVPIGARAFEIIEVLLLSANGLVTRNDVMDRVWPGGMVGENTLHVHISAIRKALGPDRAMLHTASGRGYRLLGTWSPHQPGLATAWDSSASTYEPGAPHANNFPLIAGRLIGRTAAVRHVRDLVSAYRIVTLTGPGGVGKTSLAIEASRGLFANFNGGACFVELASLSNPEPVPATAASALELNLSGEISAESVARAIGARHLLLVLDNCEHIIDAAANLAERITRLCPNVSIVATSRELLRVNGEAVYRVPPLDVPAVGQEAPDHILGHGAVELFITRTAAMNTNQTLRTEDLAAVAAICRQLDGIPLAIELAAASAATLGVSQVAAGLRDRFALLTRGRRAALARQRTLRATIDWSHELLPESEQLLLRRLAVFHGGFTLAAAVAVMADAARDATAVMDGIANLVAKSLVALDTTRGVTRWYLLDTIRAYALEKLAGHGERETAARHHATYFRDLFPRSAMVSGGGEPENCQRGKYRDIDNVRAALDWCFSPGGDRAIGVDLTVGYGMGLPIVVVATGAGGQSLDLLTKALETAESVDDLDAQARR